MPDTTTPATDKTPDIKKKNANGTPRQVNFSDNVQVKQEEPPAVAATTSEDNNSDEEVKNPLYKSSRLKGYITLILASVINYSAALNSDVPSDNTRVDDPTEGQQAYAESVALVSCLISIAIFLAHLDRFTPLRNVWEKAFGDGSICELLIILFLVIWWTVATAIETSVRGIAGDGRGQYNLYYSTWCCCWTCYWTLERWLVACGWASFKAFISSWPFRAPGWIAILMASFLALMFYLDLYSNHVEATLDSPSLFAHYAEVGDGQWEWLLFVGVATLVPALVFIVIELFRTTSPADSGTNTDNTKNGEHGGAAGGGTGSNGMDNMSGSSHGLGGTMKQRSQRFSMAIAAGGPPNSRTSRQFIPQRQNPLPDQGNVAGGKGPLENILEGFCLVLLVLMWIPTVIVATTPGGAASLVGNAYFFTWMTTVFVMETFIWFVHDLRKGVHSALQVKEREYHKFQTDVLQKSRALENKRLAAGTWQNEALDDIELDDIPVAGRMKSPVIMTTTTTATSTPTKSSNNHNNDDVDDSPTSSSNWKAPPQQYHDLSDQELDYDTNSDDNNKEHAAAAAAAVAAAVAIAPENRDSMASNNDTPTAINTRISDAATATTRRPRNTNNRRNRTRAVDFEDEHDDDDDNGFMDVVPMPPAGSGGGTRTTPMGVGGDYDDPTGSTLFFEATMDESNNVGSNAFR